MPVILARHSHQAEALIPLLGAATMLATIRPVEMPTPEALLADRNDFMAEIGRLGHQAVPASPLVRLKEWIVHQIPRPSPSLTLQRKERQRMSALLVKATLVLSMVFGSAGGTVALAGNSLPDSPLYPAKLTMEQMRLSATVDPADQAALHLSLAQERVQEMVRLALAGTVPGEPTLLRLETHLGQTLELAAQLPDDAMAGLLAQAQQMAQAQEQELSQTQMHVAEPAQEPLRQASRLLNQMRQEAEDGLQDPQTFRWRHGHGRPPEAPLQPTVTPTPGGNPDCPTGECEPVGDEHRYGPQPEQPSPGAPGGNPDCPTGGCEPVGDEHRYGPQPEQPGPGAPGGNPDGTCTDCEPAGDQHQYGPQPEQPGPGEPGGNPDGTCTDCEPAGDQHQYGPQPEQPGPGEPGGNPGGACTDCEPAGDEHQNGQQPEPPSGNDGEETTPPDSSPSDQGNSQGDGGDHAGHEGGQHR
jgi:hypothetical protein